jgi:uncharacterized protein (DUF4415 family)
MDVKHFRTPKPITHAPRRKPTKAQLKHLRAAQDALLQIHMQVYGEQFMSLHVPRDWETLEEVFACHPKKVKISLLLDEAVAKFFRQKGRGYQELVNQVLRSYAELRLAKILEGPDDTTLEGEPL